MNRSDRRLLAKKGNGEAFASAIYNNTKSEINTRATENTMALMILVLHDKYGFGKKRLQEFMMEMKKQAECVNGKYASIEDVKSIINEEFEINLRGAK